MKKPRRIGFVGDTHCGSTSGLWPVEWLPGDFPYGSIRYRAECFARLLDEWPDLDMLFLMGDLIEGKAKKSDGVGVFTTHLGRQVEGAIRVLRPLTKKARKVLRVTGTPYHDSHDDPLSALDKALHITATRQVFNMRLPTPTPELGDVLNVAHHPPGGSVLYIGTKLTRQIMRNIIAAAKRKIPAARWIVRAHFHEFGSLQSRDVTCAINPCWKDADGHAIKGDYEGWQPDIGAIMMVESDLDPSGWTISPRLFDPSTESASAEVMIFSEILRTTRRRE